MNTYVLGTGLSHDGSACLIKNGKVLVAIEKERLSRIKHDGGNDALAVEYCLKAAGIQAKDLDLIVQAANFEIEIPLTRYKGKRYFNEDLQIPVHTISHHFAHAWSAAGRSPFNACNVMVIDGCGSPFEQCMDLGGASILQTDISDGMYCEKDSFYFFEDGKLFPLVKDFSAFNAGSRQAGFQFPTSYHSIGGLYSAVSHYCFGNMDDAGKLMGLAPYGRLRGYPSIFHLHGGRVQVKHDVLAELYNCPAADYKHFRTNFNHYADIARWIQDETEKALIYIFRERMLSHPHQHIAYAGGVALNAVANSALIQKLDLKSFYIQPAAGDNGLALGCALYGWHGIMGKAEKVAGEEVFLGCPYHDQAIADAIASTEKQHFKKFTWKPIHDASEVAAEMLAQGCVIGWYQGGAEFGPRALGHRSILADPKISGIKDRINARIKMREDFRPFAPVVLLENAKKYFKNGLESPYMILTDQILPEWRNLLSGIVHEDGSCRVQTVAKGWDQKLERLLQLFEKRTGIGVLLNTSLNRKGMPIVETPTEAVNFFLESDLDVLVLGNFILNKVR
ncbi:carbamoyltransferase family protein [Mucilaginibacter lacusdianchii]|uniref:carbamoyltransferase family protein n=1 Tax=Mucilaginibacter lacusdianchii TaxID=2684211 RepID=UPI00131C9DAE|nr:carbamoyltransferase C-terminal domain-containing protein [Mucilaginibacter sp. JXJ CY 39]